MYIAKKYFYVLCSYKEEKEKTTYQHTNFQVLIQKQQPFNKGCFLEDL